MAIDVVKPEQMPQVIGRSRFAGGIGFNAFTPNRQPFGIQANFDAVRDNLRNILFFRKGDYPDKPDFGVGLQDYLFDNADELLNLALSQEIRRQFAKYEPRCIIRLLNVGTPKWDDQSVVVDMDLLINNTPGTLNASSKGGITIAPQSQKGVA